MRTRTFEQTFDAYVKKAPSSWSLGTAVPALSDARGKIVLVRRFAAAAPKGIDATKWADKATFTLQAYFSDPAHGKGRYGVLAMDFVDATRAGLVLKKNF